MHDVLRFLHLVLLFPYVKQMITNNVYYNVEGSVTIIQAKFEKVTKISYLASDYDSGLKFKALVQVFLLVNAKKSMLISSHDTRICEVLKAYISYMSSATILGICGLF